MNTRRTLIIGISTLSALFSMAPLPALAHDDWDSDPAVRSIRRDIVRDEDRIRDLEWRRRDADRFHDRDESRRIQWDINKEKCNLDADRKALNRAIDEARRASRYERDRERNWDRDRDRNRDRGGRISIQFYDRRNNDRDRRDRDRPDWR